MLENVVTPVPRTTRPRSRSSHRRLRCWRRGAGSRRTSSRPRTALPSRRAPRDGDGRGDDRRSCRDQSSHGTPLSSGPVRARTRSTTRRAFPISSRETRSRTESLRRSGDRRDVRRDVLDLLLGELVLERRHRARAVRHAVDDERRRRLRLVEVRPDRAGRPGVRERVARDAAGGLEHLLARGGVARGAALGRRPALASSRRPSPRRASPPRPPASRSPTRRRSSARGRGARRRRCTRRAASGTPGSASGRRSR